MGKSPQSFGRWWQEGAAREVEKLVSEGRLHGLNTEDESEVTKCAGHGIKPETECQLSLLSLSYTDPRTSEFSPALGF